MSGFRLFASRHRRVYGGPVHIVLGEAHPVEWHPVADLVEQVKRALLERSGEDSGVGPVLIPQGLHQGGGLEWREFKVGSLLQDK